MLLLFHLDGILSVWKRTIIWFHKWEYLFDAWARLKRYLISQKNMNFSFSVCKHKIQNTKNQLTNGYAAQVLLGHYLSWSSITTAAVSWIENIQLCSYKSRIFLTQTIWFFWTIILFRLVFHHYLRIRLTFFLKYSEGKQFKRV